MTHARPDPLLLTTFTDMRRIALPAATWLVTATAVANNNDAVVRTADCRLQIGGVTVDQFTGFTLAITWNPSERAPFALQGLERWLQLVRRIFSASRQGWGTQSTPASPRSRWRRSAKAQ